MLSWKILVIPGRHLKSMTSLFKFNFSQKLRILTGFWRTGWCWWYVMVFFLTSWVWRVFWYPFCVPYIDFSNFGILISAVGHGSGYLGANSLYIHYWSYQDATFLKKLEGDIWWVFFNLRKTCFFTTKYRFSRYRYAIPLRKFEIRMRGQKLHIAS